jgi:hypothetical protein
MLLNRVDSSAIGPVFFLHVTVPLKKAPDWMLKAVQL